ncbi:DUF6597 domain-containing transcriptional factor, partial [Myxococcus sp. CA018]
VPLPRQHRVLPDGCTDLIFGFQHAPGPVWLAAPRLAVVGPMKRFILVDLEPGGVSLGVRLRPGWAQALLGVSPRELCGLNVSAQDCSPTLTQLQRRMEDCASPAQAMALLQRTIADAGLRSGAWRSRVPSRPWDTFKPRRGRCAWPRSLANWV